MTKTIPSLPRTLGFAGLLPQALFLLLILGGDPAYSFAAQALAFAYAALIFSFLGGLWWGIAARAENPPNWLWGAAVTPSLLAFTSFLPWAFALDWPQPSLVMLGLSIIGSLAVDARLGALQLIPAWWMGLRWPLSLGLGGITILIAMLA
jgi:Protein of unknown function (DUF3429)